MEIELLGLSGTAENAQLQTLIHNLMAGCHRFNPDFSPAWAQNFLPYKHVADLARLVERLRKAGLSD